MNWERAKTILIVLFLLINIFLIFVLTYTTKNYNTISSATINDTVAVLESQGIQIKKSIIPTKHYPNQNLNVVNILSDTEAWAKRFLGEGYQTVLHDMNKFRFEYTNANKKVTVHDNCFTYELTKQVKGFSDKNIENARESTLDKLEKFIGGKENFYLTGEAFQNDLLELTLGAKYKDLKILGVNVRILADKEDIIRIEGNWFRPSEVEQVSKEKLLDVTSVLVNMVYTQKLDINGIDKVEFAYYLAEDYVNNKVVSTIPVYLITDTDQKQYIFDARSGVLLKAIGTP